MLAHSSRRPRGFERDKWRVISSRCSHRSEVLIGLLVFATICTDFAFAPVLNTVAPAFSSGLLVLLLVRKIWHPQVSREETIPLPQNWRVAAFLLLHVCGLLAARAWQSTSLEGNSGNIPPAVALTKYLVLLPAVILLPIAGWQTFLRLYRNEFIVALLALLTFYPYRVFHAVWPWYSPFLGQAVFWFSHNFVPGLQLMSSTSPVLVGPALDVVIIPACGGLQILKMFQILFALVLVLDWESLNKVRTLVAYLGGMTAMLSLNALRIALLVIVGNRWYPEFIVRHHIVVSWIFPAAFLAIFLWIGYGWLFSNTKVAPAQLEPLLSH